MDISWSCACCLNKNRFVHTYTGIIYTIYIYLSLMCIISIYIYMYIIRGLVLLKHSTQSTGMLKDKKTIKDKSNNNPVKKTQDDWSFLKTCKSLISNSDIHTNKEIFANQIQTWCGKLRYICYLDIVFSLPRWSNQNNFPKKKWAKGC